ncbi:MAG: tRNA pseudouridine(55) synthase TruB [Gammaproteobacteria bacterium]|nr:tRNA pseudouridine(55) synthase TruB [Gammaproteobacteria bacterium]
MKKRKNKGRDISGVLLLDKPSGITSNDALQKVKRLFYAQKAGHTGSLDPIATGMLPICFGEATKFSQYLLDSNKTYIAECKLGVKTTTGDSEGDVLSENIVPKLNERQIEKVLAKFRADIEQVPSMYSALKHNGTPLYKLAREGITVDRPARKVSIYELKLLNISEDILTLKVKCSKGTYIRSLVEDMGEELTCGAHVIKLRRLNVGGYSEDAMIPMEKLQVLYDEDKYQLDNLLLPINSIFDSWQEVKLSEAAFYYVKQGQSVIVPYAPESGQVVLRLKNGDFIGVGEVLSDGKVAPRRLLK